MATSGTIDQTRVTVAALVDKAFRRAGKNPSTVSGELLSEALTSLHTLLSSITNRGVQLFCLRKVVVNIKPNSAAYPMPTGTDDILNVLYRQLTIEPGVNIAGPDWVGIVLDVPTAIANVSGYFAASGSPKLIVEYDLGLGAGWQPLVEFGQVTVEAGADFVSDIARPVVATNWRVRDISGNAVPMVGVLFRTIFNELNMSQLNRDDYVNLPNKNQTTTGKALQFWYDKQLDPTLWVWPVAMNAFDQMVIYQEGLIEDVGNMTNTIAVPKRWYEAIIFGLAELICLELPPEELPPGRLEILSAKAAEQLGLALTGESDGSAYRLAPNIGVYTR